MANYESVEQARRRVAVIGAGPSGLSLLRAFTLAKANGIEIPDITCYEKQSDWGGMWTDFTWQTGVGQDGEPIHSSMYRNLYTNLPKEYQEFSDYTYDQHFTRPVPSYLNREQVQSYIIGRMKDLRIKELIKFKTSVKFVERDAKTDRFSVRVQDLTSGKLTVEQFDYVVVAVGHFSTPNLPSFDGMNSFPGRISHSHDFRDAREYKGQNVLVIGGSFSAEDIAIQLHKFGAQSVTVSYRTKPLGHKWPSNVEEVPLLVRLEGKMAHFRDGSARKVDSIILCTGYQNRFPFMADGIRLITRNRMYPDNLYKGIFFQDEPRITFLGMQKFAFGFLGLDIQAWYVRDVLLHRIALPGKEERLRNASDWQDRENNEDSKLIPNHHIYFMVNYLKDLLASMEDYPPVDFDSATASLLQGRKNKFENIINYRDQVFTSHVTGTEASRNAIRWIDADHEDNV